MKNGIIFRISRPICKLYPTENKNHKDEVILNLSIKETSIDQCGIEEV